ncbi:hypothetical protein [Streptomyces sp. NPDC000134]|uniref:hypothetical protein n=1 Tax=Streptomyces sp. NPDC000134 TaxID=3364536 RepID=UPI00367FD65D
MPIWEPGPEETTLERVPVRFATGAATRVKGMRWFRDPERRDIQRDLEGWPGGPSYTARPTGETASRNTLKGVAVAAGVAILGVFTSQGGSTPGGPSEDGSDFSHDHADEVDDFPVMWAAPGTIARSLPWRLDPGRSSDKVYRTHAVITDRRLLIVGFPYIKGNDELIDDEVLFGVPRSAVRLVERRQFRHGTDAKVVFADDSWCRLESIRRNRLVRSLEKPPEFLPLASLTPAQRATAESFASAQAPDAQPPLVTRNACGCFRVDVVAPSRTDAFFGRPDLTMVMASDGTERRLTEYHPEDVRD